MARRPVERADVVEAEEAALEHVVALGVLAVHPPGEVEQQLVEDARRGNRHRAGRRSRTRAAPPTRAPAGSRRRTPTRRPGSGRWGACTTRGTAGSAAAWRTSGRGGRIVTAWKARSHAAYHGYSHGSGMSSTSALFRWRHAALRPRPDGGGGWPGSPSSHRATSKWYHCFDHVQPGEGLAGDAGIVGARAGRAAATRGSRRPRPGALGDHVVDRDGGSSTSRGGAEPQPNACVVSPGRTRRRYHSAALVPSLRRVHGGGPVHDVVVDAVLRDTKCRR